MGSSGQQRCGQWLPAKRRQCASWALPGQQFCGNHQISASGTERRVPCPLDPSHTVLEAEVDAHLKKCPVIKQLQRFDDQAYFRKGLNAGSDNELEDDLEQNVQQQQQQQVRAGSKRAAVAELAGDAFRELVRRIDGAFEARCRDLSEESICEPEVCSRWSERDRRLPFQEKHAVQQASILGNLEQFGLIDGSGPAAGPAFVEFGAGRGYLSHMLCDCYGVRRLVMVERRSYKFKADRTLRQQPGVSLERLRIDIEDLDVGGVASLQPGLPYVAISKHLCGAATDLTLRCCLPGQERAPPAPVLAGVGIATCCHHLCSWKAYVNKAFFLDLGFSGEEFGLITWLSSWALSGDAEHGGPEGSGEGRSKQQSCCSAGNGVSAGGGDSNVTASKVRLSEAMLFVNPDERKELGIKCKRLIDLGRLLWLNQRGMESNLVRYVPESISPENNLLLARRPSRPA